MSEAAAKDAVLEIGCEELPSSYVGPALEQLAATVGKALDDARLGHGRISTFGTPRRLIVYVESVAPRQPDSAVETRGPAVKAAYDPQGHPTAAAAGFARSAGVAVEDLVRKQTPGGEYVFAIKHVPGKPARTLLAEIFPAAIKAVEFPRSMRWGSGELRFARPIRWLVALWGDELVEFTLDGLASERITYGHRFLAPEPAAVPQAAELVPVLRGLYVEPDISRRRESIRRQGDALAEKAGGLVAWNEDLLDEVTELVEYPTVFLGTFAESYLRLPKEVLMTVMAHHQRYFALMRPDGSLLPYFLAVRNGGTVGLDTVRAGNEKVLGARLADAAFFYDEDRRHRLAERVPALAGRLFLGGLGTMLDKTARLRKLVSYMASRLGIGTQEAELVDRTAFLCKADLGTAMVGELPELQGIMGEHYARLDGEQEAVAAGIREHYLPVRAGDPVPPHLTGLLVGIADRLDTLAGAFAKGLGPSGSQDPYALRRAAAGLITILQNSPLPVPLGELARLAADGVCALAAADPADVAQRVMDFAGTRLRQALLDRGLAYDTVEAVLAVGPGLAGATVTAADFPADAFVRATALEAFRGDPSAATVIAASVRAEGLGAQGEPDAAVEAALFEDPVESALWEAYQATAARVQGFLAASLGGDGYMQAWGAMATLKEPLDRYLDTVLVMHPDLRIRANRLGLLRRVRDLLRAGADLTKLVVS